MTTTKTMTRVHIRWILRRELPDILRIEAESFDYGWTEDDFLRVLRQRNCICLVAEHGDRAIGFLIYELHATELRVLNFAVDPRYRRTGVGAQLVTKLIGKLSSHRRTKITLAVRERNLPAQVFFRAQSFRAVRVERGYYEDSGEDAYWYQYPAVSD